MWNNCENWLGVSAPPTPLLSLPSVTSVAKYVCLCVHRGCHGWISAKDTIACSIQSDTF